MPNAERPPAPNLTDEEEARIQAGIAADPDNPEWTKEDFARAVPASEFFTPEQLDGLTKRRPGQRGPGKRPAKVALKLRLDPDVIEAFRATGEGWQSRINATLQEAVRRGAHR